MSIVLSVLIVLAALPFFLLESRIVQTQVADRLMEHFTKELPLDFHIDSLAVSPSRLSVEAYGLSASDSLSLPILQVNRLDCNVRLLPLLLHKEVILNNIHLSGFQLHLLKETPQSALNLSTFLSSGSKKKTDGEKDGTSPALSLDLRSLMIRNGTVTYDILSEPPLASTDPNHLSVHFSTQLSASVRLTPDGKDSAGLSVTGAVSLNKFNLTETHGFAIDGLRLQADISNDSVSVSSIAVKLPHSSIDVNAFSLYRSRNDSIDGYSLTCPLLMKSRLATADFPTVAGLFRSAGLPQETVSGVLSVSGSTNELTASVRLHSDSLVHIDGHCRVFRLPNGVPSVETRWEQLGADAGIARLFEGLVAGFQVPDFLPALDYVFYRGNAAYSDGLASVNGALETGLGDLAVEASLSFGNDSVCHVEGALSSTGLGLDRLGVSPVITGPVSFEVAVGGDFTPEFHPMSLRADLQLKEYSVNHCPLSQLTAQAEVKGSQYSATLVSEDEDCRMNLSARYHAAVPSSDAPSGISADGDLRIEVAHANLHRLHLLESSDGHSSLSFRLHTRTAGSSPEEIISQMHLELEDLSLQNNGTLFEMSRLTVNTGSHLDNAYLQIQSPLINGRIIGTQSCLHLVEEIQSGIVQRYLPSLHIGSPWMPTDDLFQFSFHLNDTRSLSHTLGLPLTLDGVASLDGEYNNETGHIRLQVKSSDVEWQEKRIVSPTLRVDNTVAGKLTLKAEGGLMKDGRQTTADVTASILKDSADVTARWTDLFISPEGMLHLHAGIHRPAKEDPMEIWACIESPWVSVQNSLWAVDPSLFHIKKDRFTLSHVGFHGDGKYLLADGVISDNLSDTLWFDLRGIDLDNVFSIINGPDDDNPFYVGGLLTTSGRAVSLLGTPRIEGNVHTEGFSLVGSLMGDLDATTWWSDDTKSIEFDAVIHEYPSLMSTGDSVREEKPIPSKLADVRGRVFPSESLLQMDLHSTGVCMDLVSYFVKPTLSITGPIYGDMTMNISLNGGDISLDGDMLVNPGKVIVHPIGTTILLNDTVRLRPRQLSFDHVEVTDGEGHSGTVTGTISHKGDFSDITFDLQAALNHFKSMELPQTADAIFFGKVYASGNLSLSGTDADLHVDYEGQTESPSNFTFALGSNSVAEYEFIRFEPLWQSQITSTSPRAMSSSPVSNSTSKLNVNLQLEVTEETELTLLTNSLTGDGLQGRGNGKVRIEYNGEDVGLYGDYELQKGRFRFNLRDLIQRDFNIQQGSSIRFSGDPLSAKFDVTTSYQVKGADLSTLLDESELSSLNLTRTTIPVNCMLYLSGELQQPEIRMDLAFPNAGQEVERSVRSVINTEEAINRQVVYLLLLNAFAPNENASDTQTANANAVFGATLNTLTAQLNRLLYDALGSDRFSFGFNYNENINTGTNEWQVAMTGSWLDNRLTINGNIGQREDIVTTTSSSQFIGDFDLEYSLTRRLRLKAYSHSNDSRSFKSAMTTQGIGIIIKDSFNSLGQLWAKWRQSTAAQREKSLTYADFPKEVMKEEEQEPVLK